MPETLTQPELSQNGTVEKPKTIKLNLASGSRKLDGKEDFLRIDISKACNPDMVLDLTVTPWPFETDSVDEVWCAHFLEHLEGEERAIFMNELWRVLKPKAKAQFLCPYWSSMRSVQDYTHKYPPICEATFAYFNKAWRDSNELSHYSATCDFDFDFGYQLLAPDPSTRSTEVQTFWVSHYLNAAADIMVTLTKKA